MIDQSRIRDKIDFIRRNLRILRELAQVPQEVFEYGSTEYHAAVRLLQISIEAMIDVGAHIVSREGLGTPKTYAEVFDLLANAGIIPASFSRKAKTMTRFRNRAVHLYDEVSADQVHDILQHGLVDFDEFLHYVVSKYLS